MPRTAKASKTAPQEVPVLVPETVAEAEPVAEVETEAEAEPVAEAEVAVEVEAEQESEPEAEAAEGQDEPEAEQQDEPEAVQVDEPVAATHDGGADLPFAEDEVIISQRTDDDAILWIVTNFGRKVRIEPSGTYEVVTGPAFDVETLGTAPIPPRASWKEPRAEAE